MRSELAHNPVAGVVRVVFDRPREQLVVRAAAVVSRDAAIDARTSVGADDGAGADPTLTTLTATAPGQTLVLAGPTWGTVASLHIARGAELYLQSSAFLARTPDVGLDAKWHGARGFFPRGAVLVRAWGEGEIWYAAYGSLHAVDIGTRHASYACAAEHVVAFTEGVQHVPRKSRKSGDAGPPSAGWVDFSGSGRLWLQTRNPSVLAGFLHPWRRVGGPALPERREG